MHARAAGAQPERRLSGVVAAMQYARPRSGRKERTIMQPDIAILVLPLLVAFMISAVTGHFLIPFLQKKHATQTERDDGPASHLKKTGTPNMGGIMFILAFLITGIIFSFLYSEFIPVMILTVGFGIVGFVDDFIKNILHRSKGLSAWQKIILQIGMCLLFAWYIREFHGITMAMKVPFAPGVTLHFGVFNIPIMIFIIVATVNGTNLTDGVDGLLACVTVAVTLFFVVAAYVHGSSASVVGMAMIGALLGFILYNAYPARIFMGDTGSLALGGFVIGMAYLLQMPLFIPIVGFIYMLEAISVIIQVLYYKKTRRRFFRMAPIHHHFEKGGWSEVRVVAVFTIVTVILSVIALLAID